MFCKNCGTQLDDTQKFCANCGTPTEQAENVNNAANTNPPQQPINQGGYYNPVQPSYMPAVDMPMKWYKFLIYFALIAGAILNAADGLLYITGYIYEMNGSGADLVYTFYSGMQPVNIIYGIALIGFAAFAIYVRFQLSGYKKNAPMCVTAMYVISAAIAFIYNIATAAILSSKNSVYMLDIGENVVGLIGQGIVVVIVTVIAIALNNIYFKKRKHLFVN